MQTDGAAIAIFATPGDAVAGTQFLQGNSTSRTKKFSIHAGMMCEGKRAVDNGEAGSRGLLLWHRHLADVSLAESQCHEAACAKRFGLAVPA
jgi:hypothetical protein